MKKSIKVFGKIQRYQAFTLAEVLITLGVIGVVAAMTILVLGKSTADQEYKTAYRKAFSVASQSWAQAVAENNIEYRASWTDAVPKVNNFNTFKSYFRVVKDCNASNNVECWASGDKYYGAYPASNAIAFIDSSGMSWSIPSNDASSGSDLLVDVNGLKPPNKYGQDRFALTPVESGGNPNVAGIPVKVVPIADVPGYNVSTCPSGNAHPCYYKSWIIGGN